MEQLSVEDWKPDACPKNITVEEYLATFPKIKLTRREYLQTIPLYHAALYLAETEGLKVNLCLEHHRNGPAAVHNNAKNARILMAKAQEVYERTHTREEWMKNAGKNYL